MISKAAQGNKPPCAMQPSMAVAKCANPSWGPEISFRMGGCCCVRVGTDVLTDDGTIEAEPHLAQWAEIDRDSEPACPQVALPVGACLCI